MMLFFIFALLRRPRASGIQNGLVFHEGKACFGSKPSLHIATRSALRNKQIIYIYTYIQIYYEHTNVYIYISNIYTYTIYIYTYISNMYIYIHTCFIFGSGCLYLVGHPSFSLAGLLHEPKGFQDRSQKCFSFQILQPLQSCLLLIGGLRDKSNL